MRERHQASGAITAHRIARAISKDAGIVKHRARLLDALAVADTDGILRDVRQVAAGES